VPLGSPVTTPTGVEGIVGSGVKVGKGVLVGSAVAVRVGGGSVAVAGSTVGGCGASVGTGRFVPQALSRNIMEIKAKELRLRSIVSFLTARAGIAA